MSEHQWYDSKIFIAAPRELSARRFTEIVRHYLPKGSITLGLSKEPYVVGFEDQPQFRMLQRDTIQPIIDKVAASSSPNKIHIYEYHQADFPNVVRKLNSRQRVLLVNGSWKYAFHNSESYAVLTEAGVPIKFISPFTDENDAVEYEASHTPFVPLPPRGTLLTSDEMFDAAQKASVQSYDYSFQVGVALGKRHDDKYEIIATLYNKVIPYQTYALHHGNSRERHLSKPHDANHYDTVHAEMQLLIESAQGKYDLEGTTLFINLLPCPNCARTLSQTAIDTVMYKNDHSDGYAKQLLELCGKKVIKVS